MKNSMHFNISVYVFAVCLCASAFAGFAKAQIASGGNFTLTQTSIAGGGVSGAGASKSGNYLLEGTIGQAAAGTNQHNSSYKFQPGFWTAQTYAPTAGEVSIGGRVLTADGRGIENVLVTMVRSNGESRMAISSAFGYFRFVDVAAGETYVFSVSAKRFTFDQPALMFSVVGDSDDLIFTANNEHQ
jgi:Carboxypeptidase regulatory-like domain